MICGSRSSSRPLQAKPARRHGVVRVSSVRCVAAAAASKVETAELGKSGETRVPVHSCLPLPSSLFQAVACHDTYHSSLRVLAPRVHPHARQEGCVAEGMLQCLRTLCPQEAAAQHPGQPVHHKHVCTPPSSPAGLQVPVMGIGAWSWGDRSGYWGYGKGYGECVGEEAASVLGKLTCTNSYSGRVRQTE